MLNKFTVDVEDWFHGLRPDPRSWGLYDRRCGIGTEKLLGLLETSGTEGTFFILGDVARHEPEVVRAIDRRGHEIGTHGLLHQRVPELGPRGFREDLRQSADILQQITGKKVACYRAPYFSVPPGCDWFFDILAEEGIRHDSSIFPARAPYYGSPEASMRPHRVRPGLTEWPVSVAPIGRHRLPFAGGAWFRLAPPHLFELLRAKHAGTGLPLIFYIHPWELDPAQPVAGRISATTRCRHYGLLHRTENKLRRLLSGLAFEPIGREAAPDMCPAGRPDNGCFLASASPNGAA